MRRSVCTLRKSAMVFVAGLSVVFALFLVQHLVTPGRIGQIADPGLVAVLALLVLPGATAVAWELDRRAAQRVSHREAETMETPAARVPPSPRIHPRHSAKPSRRSAARHSAPASRVK